MVIVCVSEPGKAVACVGYLPQKLLRFHIGEDDFGAQGKLILKSDTQTISQIKRTDKKTEDLGNRS